MDIARWRRRLVLAALLSAVPGLGAACEVADVSGPARIVTDAGGLEPVVGMRLGPGQQVETGADARVTLDCDGGLTVAIAPGSRLEIDRLLTDTATGWRRLFRRGGQMHLFEGAAGFLLHRLGDARFRVRTPNAVAAVRSTEWAMETTPDQSAVFVRAGRVRATGGGSSQALGAGEGLDFTRGGAAGVRQWPEARVAALTARIGGAWQ